MSKNPENYTLSFVRPYAGNQMKQKHIENQINIVGNYSKNVETLRQCYQQMLHENCLCANLAVFPIDSEISFHEIL